MTRSIQKRLLQLARGAPRWQQDGDVAERHRVERQLALGEGAGEHRPCQFIQERHAGRDRVDATCYGSHISPPIAPKLLAGNNGADKPIRAGINELFTVLPICRRDATVWFVRRDRLLLSAVSASARPSGEPTCIHLPSRRRP